MEKKNTTRNHHPPLVFEHGARLFKRTFAVTSRSDFLSSYSEWCFVHWPLELSWTHVPAQEHSPLSFDHFKKGYLSPYVFCKVACVVTSGIRWYFVFAITLRRTGRKIGIGENKITEQEYSEIFSENNKTVIGLRWKINIHNHQVKSSRFEFNRLAITYIQCIPKAAQERSICEATNAAFFFF